MIFSPQMLNTFRECPVKYFLRYVKNIQAPVLERSFVVGKNIHALAAYYLRGQDISMFTLSENETQMWNNLVNSHYFNLKTARVESTVACNIAQNWIGGRLDALVKNEDDEYFILDYKTGEIPREPRTNFQTIVYLLCCDKLIPERRSLDFVYISVKTGKTESIRFTEELKKEYETMVETTLSDIEKLSEPDVKRIKHCAACPYLKNCYLPNMYEC